MAHKPTSRKKPTRTTSRSRKPASKGGSFKLPQFKTKKTKQSRPPWQWNTISNERKLDVLGITLAVLGFLTVLSLLSQQRSNLTGWWVASISKVAGWGTFILPIALLIIGIWLVLRNVEKLPLFSAERVSGILILYLNILAWLHLFSGGGWALAQEGHGGGLVGAFFEQTLTNGLGFSGAVVVLIAWLIIALGLTMDVSIPDLFRKIQPALDAYQQKQAQRREAKRLERIAAIRAQRTEDAIQTLESLPNAADQDNPSEAYATDSAANPPEPDHKKRSPARKAEIEPEAADTGPQPSVTQGAAADQWVLPDIKTILDPADLPNVADNGDKERALLIEETLESFGAPVKVVEIKRGPTITQFGVEPQFIENRKGRTRVRVSKITNLADDLALALAAPRIRIQAPVPGHNYIGIEVPNPQSARVTLLEVLESKNFTKKKSNLRFALGMDVSGDPAASDLSNLPHLLIAGTTGSGKSVCVNSVLCCLLLNNTPAELRLILVDPKRVELTGYNHIPHLLAPVITDTEKVVGALQWVQREMDARYHRFSQVGCRNLQDYNKKFADKLPYMVVVIDELADLMMLAPDETERSLTRLAQLARATGIHLILATQRPSTDVVTGLIKANFPARVAFAVASNVDSRVILDQPGAERLLGRGDMLFQAPDAPAPVRLQGVFITDQEIARTVDYWKLQAMNIAAGVPATAEPKVDIDSLPEVSSLKQTPLFEEMQQEDDDPLTKEATDLVRREGRASITMLQRRLRIGYTRAARMIDTLEDKGIISPPLPHSNVREILDYGPVAPPADDGY